MRDRNLALGILLLGWNCLVGAQTARAQAVGAQTLAAGSEVRLWAANPPLRKVVATVRTVRNDTLVLSRRSRRQATELLVPVSAVSRLEVPSRRSAGRGAARGAALGALAGVAMGIVAGGLMGDEPVIYALMVTVPSGLVGGAVFGAFAGATRPGNAWRCAPGFPCVPASMASTDPSITRPAATLGMSFTLGR